VGKGTNYVYALDLLCAHGYSSIKESKTSLPIGRTNSKHALLSNEIFRCQTVFLSNA